MAERGYLVVSAIGPDQPGLVSKLTSWIVRHDGNVEDSRMAVLGGSFGVMMLVSGAADDLHVLQSEADEIEAQVGLRLHLEQTTAPRTDARHRRFVVQVEAADREGIVHAIAEALLGLGGNIVNLESTLYPAPMSGAPLFKLKLFVDVDGPVDVAKVEAALATVADAELLDCRIVAR